MRERRELGRGTGMGRAEEKEERATRMEKGKRRGEKVGRWEEMRPARENHGPEARLAQKNFKFDFPNTFSNEF